MTRTRHFDEAQEFSKLAADEQHRRIMESQRSDRDALLRAWQPGGRFAEQAGVSFWFTDEEAFRVVEHIPLNRLAIAYDRARDYGWTVENLLWSLGFRDGRAKDWRNAPDPTGLKL